MRIIEKMKAITRHNSEKQNIAINSDIERNDYLEKIQEEILTMRREIKEIQHKQDDIIKNEDLKQKKLLELDNQNELLMNAYKENKTSIKNISNDIWMEKYGYYGLIASLQLAAVESLAKDNRYKLKSLQNSHKGESCFVVANGPSLKAEDLTALSTKNKFSLGANGINRIYSSTKWRPNIWVSSDLKFIKNYQEEISEMRELLMLPCQAIIDIGLHPVKNAIYYPFLQVGERRDAWFNYDITKGVHFWGTVTVKMINFAVYMGFTKIYLLGVDMNYPTKRDPEGKLIIDTSKLTHFSKSYYSKNDEAEYFSKDDFAKTFEYMKRGFETAKYFCDLKGIEIYNATRGGNLEIFPRVDFDLILNGERNDEF